MKHRAFNIRVSVVNINVTRPNIRVAQANMRVGDCNMNDGASSISTMASNDRIARASSRSRAHQQGRPLSQRHQARQAGQARLRARLQETDAMLAG